MKTPTFLFVQLLLACVVRFTECLDHCNRIQHTVNLAHGLRADFGSRIATSETIVRKDCPCGDLSILDGPGGA